MKQLKPKHHGSILRATPLRRPIAIIVCLLLQVQLTAAQLPSDDFAQRLNQSTGSVDILSFMKGVLQEQNSSISEWIKSVKERAARGEAFDRLVLSALYLQGEGVPQSYAEAFSIVKALAENGDALACFDVGLAYSLGRGVMRDYGMAFVWFDKAANLGIPVAQENMGYFYEYGIATARDPVEAYKWFNLAAIGGLESAKRSRARSANIMTTDQIIEAQKRSVQWKSKIPGK